MKINDNPYRSSTLDRPETFFSKPQLDKLAAQRKVTQIIVGALILSMVFFFIVIAVVGGSLANPDFSLGLNKFITIIAIGYAVVGIIASQVITKFIHKKTPMTGDTPTEEEVDKTHEQFQKELLIRSALLDGGGFFCLVAFMIESNLFALIGAVVCLFLISLNFPKENSHLYDVQRRLTDRA